MYWQFLAVDDNKIVRRHAGNDSWQKMAKPDGQPVLYQSFHESGSSRRPHTPDNIQDDAHLK